MSSAQWLDQVHHGDCLKVMRQMPDESVDLVFTSPPYNMRCSSGNGLSSWPGYEGHEDNLPHGKYVRWQRDCLREMMRLIPETGAIFYNHCHRVQHGLLQSHQDILTGFPLRQVIIWHRSGGINHNPGYFLPDYEVIYLIAKSKFRLVQNDTAVWRIHQDAASWIPEIPTFPVDLPLRAISATSAQVILDPFIGSGSTAVAAKIAGRQYIGIEQSDRYCRIATQRIDACIPGEPLPIPESCYPAEPPAPPLSKSARLVYEYIAARLAEAGTLTLTLRQRDMAYATSLSAKTVERSIRCLKNGGWIQLDDHGQWCDYTVTRNDGTAPKSPRNDGTAAPPGMTVQPQNKSGLSPRNDGTAVKNGDFRTQNATRARARGKRGVNPY